ncbi:hypothetical protein N6H18_12880 [Reichenbachiella agarivorans]|uniref:HMA domain-containing protein n=1 Tax=Reichenbachiella agarivorans TaxID=2979464 RepID=A0ABY6CPF6_9BACT|nr:hypothetical protein [Reichenbachiella agarivorans]UXP31243.1 hypothetical protein N6H18_12880 [Reichenbachiella agarivorans]
MNHQDTIMMNPTYIEVFKTNVDCQHKAADILKELLNLFSYSEANFDLDDCDRVLRIVGENIEIKEVIKLINQTGYHCEVMS